MSGNVKIDDAGDISFKTSETIPTSPKKFRKSPEIAAFYKFIYEHDLQREAFQIVDFQFNKRKKEQSLERAAQRIKKKKTK